MLELLTVLLLAIAVSFDTLAIGMTYGMAKIVIPILPRILLSAISFVSILAAMFLGDILIMWLSPTATNYLGGGILVLLGIYTLWRTYQHADDETINLSAEPIEAITIDTVVRIFKDPLEADYDRSKTISLSESVFLGLALAFDAFAAGIGAAILDFPHVPTSAAVMVFSFIFLSTGIYFGQKANSALKGWFIKWIPGAIIILIGLAKISF